jgi:YVTN family beta-propeller protein
MKIRTALLAATAGSVLIAIVGGDVGAQSPGPDLVPKRAFTRAQQAVLYEETVMPRPVRTKHLVYAGEPGGTANGMLPFPNGGVGIVVLDADHGYKYLKRFAGDVSAAMMPGPEVTGMTASPATNMLYVAYRMPGALVAYDLATEKVVWTFKGEPGPVKIHFFNADISGCCERPWTLPDGKTLLVGSSYNNWWYVIDATTGKVRGKIGTPNSPLSHNLAVTPDGKTAFLSSLTTQLSIADVASRKVLRTIPFSDAVRVMAINHDGSRVYVNTEDLLGFEIGDRTTGKMIKRVEAPAEIWKAKFSDPASHFFGHGGPSHGIGMTPDEKEMWVVDNINYGVLVFDNTGNDNWTYDVTKSFKTTYSSGWISMTNDGKTAFLGDGDIVDVKTHKIIGQLKDENGQVLATEKTLYLAFRDGHLIEANNQFAEGLPASVEANLLGNKHARN